MPPPTGLAALDRHQVCGCPTPLPDPRRVLWEDVGGVKQIVGLNRRWVRSHLIQWHAGEDGNQGGVYPSGHYRIPGHGCKEETLHRWAREFGPFPLDSIGVLCPPCPGDRLLRTELDLASLIEARSSEMCWQDSGDVDWPKFADSLRPGYYPVHTSDVMSVGVAIVNRLVMALTNLVAPSTEHESASLGTAIRLAVTQPLSAEQERSGIKRASQLTAERFVAGFLGPTQETAGYWGQEQEEQLSWVQSVAQQATKVLGELCVCKERKIKANKIDHSLLGAKERMNPLHKEAKPRSEPLFKPGWGLREAEQRRAVSPSSAQNEPEYDHSTQLELAAQLEELRLTRAQALWGTTRNIAAASTHSKHVPGRQTDRKEEERLDAALQDMFDHDQTRMLLLYRLPDGAVVNSHRPDWGRIIRNKPEFYRPVHKKSKCTAGVAEGASFQNQATASNTMSSKATRHKQRRRPGVSPDVSGRVSAPPTYGRFDNYNALSLGAGQRALEEQEQRWDELKASLRPGLRELSNAQHEWESVRNEPRPDKSVSLEDLATEFGIDLSGHRHRQRSRFSRSFQTPLGPSRSENSLPVPRRQ